MMAQNEGQRFRPGMPALACHWRQASGPPHGGRFVPSRARSDERVAGHGRRIAGLSRRKWRIAFIKNRRTALAVGYRSSSGGVRASVNLSSPSLKESDMNPFHGDQKSVPFVDFPAPFGPTSTWNLSKGGRFSSRIPLKFRIEMPTIMVRLLGHHHPHGRRAFPSTRG